MEEQNNSGGKVPQEIQAPALSRFSCEIKPCGSGFENLHRQSCPASLEQHRHAAGQSSPGGPA